MYITCEHAIIGRPDTGALEISITSIVTLTIRLTVPLENYTNVQLDGVDLQIYLYFWDPDIHRLDNLIFESSCSSPDRHPLIAAVEGYLHHVEIPALWELYSVHHSSYLLFVPTIGNIMMDPLFYTPRLF